MQSDRELMQQALETLDADEHDMVPDQEGHMVFRNEAAIAALRARLAQPKQEPVAWTPQVWWQFRPDGTLEFQKIKRTPNGAWEDYTTPPRREWVGLTEEEAFACRGRDYFETYRAIEAKLKDKNNAD